MAKRRRVDLKMRLEDAKAAEAALDEWLSLGAEVADGVPDNGRVRRVLGALRRGIAYVEIENPTSGNRQGGARA